MIFDITTLFSNKQAITATAVSTNIVDTGVAGTPFGGKAPFHDDKGKGTPICILIQATEDFNTLTSLVVTLETSDSDDLTSSTVLNTETILLADLTAGKQTFMQYVPNGAIGRYLGVRYTVVGTDPTTGAIMAGITLGNQTNFTGP